MKSYSKRGSAVLDAPEETYAPATERKGRGPASANALRRSYAGGFGTADDREAEAVETPKAGPFRLRLRGGVPKSIAGKVLVGTAGFLCLGAAAFGVFEAHNYLLHDERFVIPASEQIQIDGNTHLTRAQVLSVFGEDVERNIFKVPLATRRADLERLPWVSHATVMRLLPNRLRIQVTERTPVAFVRQGTHIGLVDGTGVLLDMPEDAAGDPHYSFPVLTGLSADDPLSTRAARMEIYRRFVKELDGSGEKVTDHLSEVDVSSPEDVKALIPSGGTDILVHFGDENFLERYRHFEEHLPDWKTQYPKLASADMRYDRQVVLEMQAGAGVPLTTAAAPAGGTDTSSSLAADKPAQPTTPAKPAATESAQTTVAHQASKPKAAEHAAAHPASVANAKASARLHAALLASHHAAALRTAGQVQR